MAEGRAAAGSAPVPIATSPDPQQAELDHLRRTVRQREAALDALQRRPFVRAVIGLDRRLLPLRRTGHRLREALSSGGSRARVTISGLPARAGLARSRERLEAALASLPPPPRPHRSVTVVVGPGCDRAHEVRMAVPPLEVIPVVATGSTQVTAVANAFEQAHGDLVCLIAPSSRPLEDGWLERLMAAIHGDVAAAVPLLVHPSRELPVITPHDLLVREEGLQLEAVDGAPRVCARRAGAPVDLTRAPERVDSGSSACFLIDRAAYREIGGFAPMQSMDAAVIDLCVRLGRGGKEVVVVPSAIVEDQRRVSSVKELGTPVVDGSIAWRELVDRSGSHLLRVASPSPGLRVACSVAVPGPKVAARWGDWHLARTRWGTA